MLTDEQLTEIERLAAYFAERTDADLNRLVGENVPALLAEVKQLREQLRVTRIVGEDETRRAAYEAMDAERRGQESRRAIENLTLATVQRERDTALAHVRRIEAQRDAAARAVRSPDLTDAEKLTEVRQALAVVDGEREDGEAAAHAGSVWTCPACLDTTCGDCIEGRCHGSGPCGCARHEASVQARQLHEGGEGPC